MFLLALATMPGQVTTSDLAVAHSALMSAHGLAASKASFEAAMRIVDDSFIRSHEESDQTFVTLANPSIDDYIAGWVDNRSDEMLLAIESVTFFEQLVWLVRRDHDGKDQAFDEALVGALERAWGSPSPSWQQVIYASDKSTHTLRVWDPAVSRLLFVASLIAVDSVQESPLRMWMEGKLKELAQSMARQVGRAGESVSLLVQLRSKNFKVPPAFIESLRDGLRMASYSYAWEKLAELREMEPSYFSEKTNIALESDFTLWLKARLEDVETIDHEFELDSMRDAARAIGVPIDEDAFDSAAEEIRNRPRDVSDEGLPRVPTASTAEDDSSNDGDAIRALFARLTNEVL